MSFWFSVYSDVLNYVSLKKTLTLYHYIHTYVTKCIVLRLSSIRTLFTHDVRTYVYVSIHVHTYTYVYSYICNACLCLCNVQALEGQLQQTHEEFTDLQASVGELQRQSVQDREALKRMTK